MNIAEWAAEAQADEAVNLCKLNYDRDTFGGSRGWQDSVGVTAAMSRFETDLATRRGSTARNHSAEVLKIFSSADILDREHDSAAYIGIQTKGLDQFVALKNLAFLETNGDQLGYPGLDSRTIASIIRGKMTKTSYGYTHGNNLNADARRMIDATLKRAINATTVSAAASVTARTPSLPPGHLAVGTPSRPPVWFPVWVTTKSAVDGMGATPTSDDTQRVKSVFVAGLKDRLGLFNPTDTANDRDFSEGTFEKTTKFRVKVLLNMIVKPSEPWPKQPCLFSLGDKAIYVSRKEPHPVNPGLDSMPGRTVHLQDPGCLHTAGCNCNTPGLPEAILPECKFLEQTVTLMASAVLFDRDLKHEIGPTGQISSRNPI